MDLNKAINDALGGGIPGMAAMAIQVSTLMWLRTTMNYQYKYGVTTEKAMRDLWRQGGIRRFYAGYSAALIQGPLSRFGDTAANMGVMSLLEPINIPIAAKTAIASTSAASFRILLMPVDTIKTMFQVEGTNKGWDTIKQKVRLHGPSVLFHGSIANAAATLAGHYPWYTTYNYLNWYFPNHVNDSLTTRVIRSAAIGFCCSLVSDTISNGFRVVKTTRQTAATDAGYVMIIRQIINNQGVVGLLGRGLKTRILTNGLQGLMFSVLWRLGQEEWKRLNGV